MQCVLYEGLNIRTLTQFLQDYIIFQHIADARVSQLADQSIRYAKHHIRRT